MRQEEVGCESGITIGRSAYSDIARTIPSVKRPAGWACRSEGPPEARGAAVGRATRGERAPEVGGAIGPAEAGEGAPGLAAAAIGVTGFGLLALQFKDETSEDTPTLNADA